MDTHHVSVLFTPSLIFLMLTAGVAWAQPATPSLEPFLSLRDVTDVGSIGRMRDWYAANLADVPTTVRDEAALAIRAHMDAVVAEHIRDGHKPGILANAASTEAEVCEYAEANGERFHENGLALFTLEGSELYCQIDPGAPDGFLRPLIESTSPEVSAYLGLHSDWLYTEGLLSVSFADLSPYVAEHDAYLRRFPDSPRAEQVRSAYHTYLAALLTGGVYSASEMFDVKGTVQPVALDALWSFVHTYPDSSAADVVLKYLDLLRKHDFRYNKELYTFVAEQAPPGLRYSPEAYEQWFFSPERQFMWNYDQDQQRKKTQNAE